MGRLAVLLSTYDKTPNLGKVIAALEVCTRQDKVKKILTNSTSKLQAMDFYHLNLKGGHGMSKINTDGSCSEDTVHPSAFCVIIKGTCYLCKQPGNLARIFPRGMKTAQPTCQPVTQNQITSMTAKYHKSMV
ncbi:hypothetical protein O181_058978 [Austropuccinia psidii MF-1]|uniref:Uncharacterized protein n=1 Tax=Austropuccinia psidii MF-1 TaxID=1389203 RepID=A0A9Q3HW37_9BASI|nr:hypothetical protein [Austropuccinia psidii MF-1]